MIDLKSSVDADQQQPGDIDRYADALDPAAIETPPVDQTALRIALGEQLRAAREAQGLDIAQCAHALHLPVRVLKKLETGDHSGISEGVYLRNYVLSYGASVGVPEATLREAIAQLAPPERKPALVSTGSVPHAHYLWQRYTTLAASVVLTALVVVPLVWVSFKGGLDRELAQLEPLNSAAVTTRAVALGTSVDPKGAGVALTTKAEKPLMASMAPFSALDSVDNPPPAPVPSVAPSAMPAAPAGEHSLSVSLDDPSWVEITTADGKRLEYSLLPAGTHKVYQSQQPLQVSIGDAAGAQIKIDGRDVDLATYKHANVAHFRVALEDGKAVAQTM